VEDIKRRLLGWQPITASVKASGYDPGLRQHFTITDPDHKAIVHPGTRDILGIVGKDYKVHDYTEWLLDNAQLLLDAPELGIGSAGLLRKGALAWVQIELDETIEGPAGIAHRPFFTAATSLDGQMSTTYQVGTQLVVCDNTLSAALGSSNADRVKVRHRSRSLARVQDVRERLGIMYQNADDVNAELDQLLSIKVSEAEWEKFVAAHIGRVRPTEAGASQSRWDNQHDALDDLWTADPRVQPWHGTGFGVVQAVNTYRHHEGTVKGMSRAERNMTNMVTGEWDKLDAATLNKLNLVLAS
jgi:phage/plasmid-like protein (TIGR03299 family)